MREPPRPDPDVLSIQRKRRQQGRCLRCGVKTRGTLCIACRVAWRACPRCERVYDRRDACHNGARPSCYCKPCHNIQVHGVCRTAAEDRARRRAAPHPLLPAIMRMYRRGLPSPEIGAALGISDNTVRQIITRARKNGQWPAGLRRLV